MPSTVVLYRKWRPQTLGQVIGQEHVTRTLLNALATGRVSHAYIFCGPRGTGKTSTARILAKAVNCLTNGKGEPCGTCTMCEAIAQGRALDLVEIDAASNRGIDDIRELREKITFAPNEARYKVYVVDEVHMLTDPAFNALLKTLEEPPPHAIFVLATTEVQQVPVTILSRCQRFDFRRISQQVLVEHLAHICAEEGIEAEREALELIVRSASGSARDAVNLLEQAEVSYGGRVQLQDVQALLGITGDTRSMEVVKAVVHHELQQGMAAIQQVREEGVNLAQFGREVASLWRALLLLKAGTPEAVDVAPELLSELRGLAGSVSMETIAHAARAFSQLDFRAEAGSSLPLELALLDTVMPETTQAAVPPAPTRRPQERPPIPRETRAEAPVRPEPPAYGRPTPAPPRPAPATPVGREAGLSTPQVGAAEKHTDEHVEAAAVLPSTPKAAPLDRSSFSSDLEYIQQVIKDVRIPQLRFIESLLRNGCTVERLEGQTLILGFKPGLTSHKERMEKPENLRLAERAVKELTGTEYRIRCVMVGQGPPPPRQGEAKGHLVRAALDAGARRVPRE